MRKNKKKPSSKNLNIATRITISTIMGIAIPLVIVFAFSSIVLNTMASYFDFSTVTTNSYSMLNQIQWNQTMSSISNELVSDDEREEKVNKVTEFVSPLESLGSMIYIECNGKPFYSTMNKKDIIHEANAIVAIDPERNTHYYGENGMVIVNHAENESERYLVIIANDDYMVNDVSARYTAQNYSSLVFGKTGLIIAVIVMIFILSTLILSLITSKTISKPLGKLADGANEIAGGNLDYVIDYESTNEIGRTVQSFNRMTRRLKESLDNQNRIEQSRKEMIAGVAHDLRTPLTSVKGYVEGLRDGIASTPEMQERYLSTIYTSTLAMEKLLDELLTTSRLELGSIELHQEIVNLNRFLESWAEDVRFDLEKLDFDFVYDNQCDDPLYVALDTDRFTRVLGNILSNAVKYSRKDRKGKITLAAQSYKKSVIISLADNGIGMDEKSLPRIFETFYRADPARTKVSEGSGIGLAVCKQIVELHGGHIWATGKEGEGLTVLISLERRNEEENE